MFEHVEDIHLRHNNWLTLNWKRIANVITIVEFVFLLLQSAELNIYQQWHLVFSSSRWHLNGFGIHLVCCSPYEKQMGVKMTSGFTQQTLMKNPRGDFSKAFLMHLYLFTVSIQERWAVLEKHNTNHNNPKINGKIIKKWFFCLYSRSHNCLLLFKCCLIKALLTSLFFSHYDRS